MFKNLGVQPSFGKNTLIILKQATLKPLAILFSTTGESEEVQQKDQNKQIMLSVITSDNTFDSC